MSDFTPKEIEFKYKADNISLVAFKAFCEARNPMMMDEASGFDWFYSKDGDASSFGRHRKQPGVFNQLSFKRKTVDNNNFVRTEHNIMLGDNVETEQVAALFKEFGYTYNISIFKSCFIYHYQDHILVYYICFDPDFKELGRFIEIEMDEDWATESPNEAMAKLTQLEGELKTLGISRLARIKRSLFEMFRK